MSTALQVALFVASITFIVLTLCIIPAAFHLRRKLETERTLRGEEKLQDSPTICRYAQTLLPKDCNQNLQGKWLGSRRSNVRMGRDIKQY